MKIQDDGCVEEITIKNPLGIHARPSALIYKYAREYPKFVYLTRLDKPGNIYDCKEVMSLMSMEAYKGDSVVLHVEGVDEEARQFCEELSDLLGSDFEEAY